MTHSFTSIANYSATPFEATCNTGYAISHAVFRRSSGPPVIIIQELPGIGPETMRLADEFVDRGFEVILPHLFGTLEKLSVGGNLMRVFCMRKEFSLFRGNGSSPIVDWLKALCRDAKRTITHTLPGKGHSVLTIDFVNERGHPTREALNDVIDYFSIQLL